MRTFGERLVQCIADRHTNQAEVARKAGISGASLSEWATDKVKAQNVKAEPLLKAAAFLQVGPLWLLTGRGQRDALIEPFVVAEQTPSYQTWPFDGIDPALVAQLKPREVVQIEGAWLLAAKQLGFSLAKPAAA